MKLAEDRWLAERLRRPAYTVREVDDLRTPLPQPLGPGFYQARVPGARVDVVRALAKWGFYVTNAGLTMACSPQTAQLPAVVKGVQLRDAIPNRDAALLEIAESTFHSSRFHLDPEVPGDVANRIKRDWVAAYLRGERGEQLIVALVDGSPAGFLAVIATEADGRPVRVIDLIGVIETQRRIGVGGALVRRFLEQSKPLCDEVQVGTQAANTSATSFYGRLGFRAVSMAYDLHLHVRGAGEAP